MSEHLVGPVACTQAIVDRVYSPFTGPAWCPKPFLGRCRRYLWSDAFGVCAYLSLYDASGRRDAKYLEQAQRLIADVHTDLGCFRDSSQRLPGASSDAPTKGGLRIGKEDAQDDGQYFHYLTKWIFALHCMARATPTAATTCHDWAVDLARVAHAQFIIRDTSSGRPLRMVWKKSVDLERVLVPSEGNLDPMDALATYRLLQRASNDANVLKQEIADMQQLVDRKLPTFATHDALDSGEAVWLSQWFPQDKWAQELEGIALNSIERLFRSGRFSAPASHRLMFREMGTVLGLEVALVRMTDADEVQKWRTRVGKLLLFWSDKVYERDADITPLMYAAARLPGVWRPPVEGASDDGKQARPGSNSKAAP